MGFWVINEVWVEKSAHKRAGFRTICASCCEKLDKNEQKLNKMKQPERLVDSCLNPGVTQGQSVSHD